jgi:predicted DNA-binding transcriptional regulator AlpA
MTHGDTIEEQASLRASSPLSVFPTNMIVNEPNKSPFDLLLEHIRQIVREEIAAHNCGVNNSNDTDRLLTPDEAAALAGVGRRWLYRHAANLPFARRINRKTLRFSEAGLRRWLAAKKPVSTR